jgi:hypothetical protein
MQRFNAAKYEEIMELCNAYQSVKWVFPLKEKPQNSGKT